MTGKLTRDDFITRAKQVHGDAYGYALVEFINTKSKVRIECPARGGPDCLDSKSSWISESLATERYPRRRRPLCVAGGERRGG